MNNELLASLPSSPLYFPIDRAIYEVAPGLKPLGFNFGFGNYDSCAFQICSDFAQYRENKLACRQERLTKYYLTHELSPERICHITRFISERLVHESPQIFELQKQSSGHMLICKHTGDQMAFDENWQLLKFSSPQNIEPAVTDSLDALALQIQEDIAITCRTPEKTDYLGLLHLCSPSHWAAEDKIGKSFFQVHKPIPGIERINKAAENMVEAMINKGPFVRFIWSFVTDKRLNHHTVAPSGWDAAKWKGRSFDASQKEAFYFRVERQVVYGMPEIEASLFTIRIAFVNGTDVKNSPERREQLLGALNSMTPESRQYKGVASCFNELTSWLLS